YHTPPPLPSRPPATTALYTLSLHDALPISRTGSHAPRPTTLIGPDNGHSRHPATTHRHHPASTWALHTFLHGDVGTSIVGSNQRSEEHTSELQSLAYLVCRLLLEKKKTINS